MKKLFHVINILLSAAIGITGVLIMVGEQNFLLEPISGGVLLAMAVTVLIPGIFFPEIQPEVLKEMAQFHEKMWFKKGWEPAAILIWGIFISLIGIFVLAGGTPKNQILIAAALIFLGILMITSVLWKIWENKEIYGKAKVKPVLLPLLVVIGIFVLCGIIGSVKMNFEMKNSFFKRIEEKSADENVHLKESQVETYTEAQLFSKLSEDFEGKKLYYRRHENMDGKRNLIVWNDTEENVYLYILNEKGENLFEIQTAMISQNLHIEDVRGKEEGIIQEKSGR